MAAPVTPELREVLRKFVILQREKYGPDWITKLAAEMTEASKPFMRAMFGQKARASNGTRESTQGRVNTEGSSARSKTRT